MHAHTVLVALALILAPLGAHAADLVVWWEKGYYSEEDEAVREIIAAFEHGTGAHVELTLVDQGELPGKIAVALEAGRPPDFLFGLNLLETQWAFDDQLADLSEAVGFFSNLFDPDALDQVMLLNARTGQRALYGLPVGVTTNHLHVWKSLLEQAGFTLADMPNEWEAFWSFWCDQVQPAARQATGREDIWGIGRPMSVQSFDTWFGFLQFVAAYEADYVTPDGRLVIDDPEIRSRLIEAIDRYTTIYRKGCTPPDAVTWGDIDNNKAFHAQTVVMTLNNTLSIVNALKRERPDDYYDNVATVEWPLGPRGRPYPIPGEVETAVVFKGGSNVGTARDFVRFLAGEGWLMHYLNFSAERFLPPISKLLDQPFWLDTTDPHHMAAAMQLASRPMMHNYRVASGDWRHDQITYQEYVWGHAIHRVLTEGISPEQAVDEAIARIKQILRE
jgi:multiple sugar transport system substrate-binding protein